MYRKNSENFQISLGTGYVYKDQGVRGRPDFILYYNESPSGYVEAEPADSNLKKLTGHSKIQNDHYCTNLDNFLLTNHLDFQLWHAGKRIATASLPDPRNGFAIPTEREIFDLSHLLDRFFGSPNVTLPALKDPRDLAEALARRTRQLNIAIHLTLQTQPTSYLHGLKKSFEAELLPNLSDNEFADLYAQTVAYGLFAARCAIQNDAVAEKKFDRLHAAEFIPASNPFLSELFQQITSRNLAADIRWITDDIARLLQAAPYVSVRPHSQRSSQREDPVIHFYETFLAAYDPKLREQRGVYYTPEPVVSYIIRSVDEILVSSFGKKDGLADDSVKILDPATGTGTFLAQTILHIYDRFKKAGNEGFFSADYVEKKLVPRLFGFELMVAPYTIAHLKLHLLLKDLCPGYDAQKRIEVYLTNTLEPPQTHPELPSLNTFRRKTTPLPPSRRMRISSSSSAILPTPATRPTHPNTTATAPTSERKKATSLPSASFSTASRSSWKTKRRKPSATIPFSRTTSCAMANLSESATRSGSMTTT